MNSTKWANQTPGECYLLPKTVMKINSHIFIGASCLVLFKELERTVNAVLFSAAKKGNGVPWQFCQDGTEAALRGKHFNYNMLFISGLFKSKSDI